MSPAPRSGFSVGSQEHWRRPDGMPATREHLMMVLADLDDVLVRASHSTDMRSSSISDVSMEVAVPGYSGLGPALEVEQCRCPPGYQGLSCQVVPHSSSSLVHSLVLTCLSSRTVRPDTRARAEVCTWATASCASATDTPTPATRRPESAR